MKITVEHYDEKVSIETKNNGITFDDFMELIRKVALGVGYHNNNVDEWFDEEYPTKSDVKEDQLNNNNGTNINRNNGIKDISYPGYRVYSNE